MARTLLSLATCNLFNLNLPGLPIYSDRDGWTAQQYEAKVNWLSRVLRVVDADCWGFQELWHKEALHDVLERAGMIDAYDMLVPEENEGQRIVCAGAVRKEYVTGQPEWIDRFPEKLVLRSRGDDEQTPEISVNIDGFSRPVLHFKIKPRKNGKTIHVFVAHLKSKGPAKVYREGWYRADTSYYKKHSEGIGAALSTIRRTAEAAALRMILVNLMKDSDTPVVVLGDINDNELSNTVNILSGQPNYIASGLDKGGGDVDLYSVGTLQEYRSLRDVYYTYIFQKQRESLDHILVSQEFYDNSRKRLWAFKRMEIWNDHLNEGNHKENGTSDHGILKAVFEYRPSRSSS